MNATRHLMAALAVLALAGVSQAATVLTSGDPRLYDGIKGEPSRVDVSPNIDIRAEFDLGEKLQVDGALVTYYSCLGGGVYKPASIDFFFSDTAGVFNGTPDATFDTSAWPPNTDGWVIQTDQLATTSGVGRYLRIDLVSVLEPAGAWQMAFEIDPVVSPEPATMSLLALGGLAVLRRKRK